MGMLQKVRAGLIDQPIGEFVLSVVLFGHCDPFLMSAVKAAMGSRFAIALASSVLGL
jgi:hypothetical protein